VQINPYLVFNGQCEAAIRFYEQCLGGKVETMIPFEDTPASEHVPAEWRKKIMHATLVVGGQVLMGSDAPPDRYRQPQGMSVSLNIERPAEAERIFQALATDGHITMPMQETFWAARFGMVTDRFGTPWMVNCEKSS
jgi:PhnB protein